MEMISVASQAVSAAGYDPMTRRMKIRFRTGRTYDFCRVPQFVFDAFMASPSKGRYFDAHIRDRYNC
ncbi:KTSC domain-containing protein [Paraburkholderia caribensis]|uniref:KTSC domain-containing protein n=1 Tax=Paraburkholderia caribensis TaxID=75105 RepID=UPI001CB30D22|nr:KTSC domain-containing protein [Paraburkholderia caribensis]